MALKLYDSPFHVTHDEGTASKMAMKMDLSILLTGLIESQKWTQAEAAEKLGVKQSRISDLMNSKIEKFTIDTMFDMLDKIDFTISWYIPPQHFVSFEIKKANEIKKAKEGICCPYLPATGLFGKRM